LHRTVPHRCAPSPRLRCRTRGPQALDYINGKYGANAITTVVSSFGGVVSSGVDLSVVPEASFDELVARNRPHFSAWATFGKQLLAENRVGTSYTFVTGLAGSTGGFGATSIGAAIQIGIARTALTEAKGKGSHLRVNETCLGFLVLDDAAYEGAAKAGHAPAYMRPSSYFAPIFPALAESAATAFRTLTLDSAEGFPAVVDDIRAAKA